MSVISNVDAWENLLLSPLVLPTDLIFLLWSEVILDVEGFADLLGGFALDHVRDSLAADIKEGLDVKVVGSQDDLKQHLLVDLHKLLVPLVDICRLPARIIVISGAWRVVFVVGAPLYNLPQDGLVDLEEMLVRLCGVKGEGPVRGTGEW